MSGLPDAGRPVSTIWRPAAAMGGQPTSERPYPQAIGTACPPRPLLKLWPDVDLGEVAVHGGPIKWHNDHLASVSVTAGLRVL